jgi:hypothetical protein
MQAGKKHENKIINNYIKYTRILTPNSTVEPDLSEEPQVRERARERERETTHSTIPSITPDPARDRA